MAIHLYFNQANVRFDLSVEDAQRLIKDVLEKGHSIQSFINRDWREKTIEIFNVPSHVTRYVIAVEGLEWCIIGDEKFFEILDGCYHFDYRDFILLGDDKYFPSNFQLYRVKLNVPQSYEESY